MWCTRGARESIARRRTQKVCIRIHGQGRRDEVGDGDYVGCHDRPRSWRCVSHLMASEGQPAVVIESTSDYWKPFYYLLERGSWTVTLVNASAVRNLPGRKTDVSDAAWLADLGAHGLVKGLSSCPPPPIRALRDLTRTRTRDHPRTAPGGGSGWRNSSKTPGSSCPSVACDITGVSGRAMLEALIAGRTRPAELDRVVPRADEAKRSSALTEALTGRFTDHHAFMARLCSWTASTAHSADISRLDERIEAAMALFFRGPGPANQHPGILWDRRSGVHRRNRRRHDGVPLGGASWPPGPGYRRDPTSPQVG